MEQLKIAWLYRFWIIVGIVALMPIISWFIDTRSLADNAQRRAAELKGTADSLETLARGPNPNDKWVQAVNGLRDTLSAQVDVAWVDLYKKQLGVMTWPQEVKDAYEAVGEQPDSDNKLDTNVKLRYQRLYPAQYSELYMIVDPVGAPKSKGLVEMNEAVLQKYIQSWAFASTPPTVSEAWLAQEDIWLLRAVLGVVARANKDSTKVQESAVKRIIDIQLGAAAADATLKSKSPSEQLAPRGNAAGETTGTATREALREIKGPLYRQIPVSLRLIVDQPRVLQVLAEFANSEIPMQVKEVQFSEVPMADRHAARLQSILGDTPKKGSQTVLGTAPPKEDEFFHMAELEVYARAILYNKPPKVEQEEREAAAKAASAAPTTPPESTTQPQP